MARLLSKKLASMARSSPFPSSLNHKVTLLTPLLHFSTQIQQKEDLPFIAQYLISSFGFSEHHALRVASDAHLSPIKTPDRPESVIRFLKEIGLTDVEIKSVISLHPRFLSFSVEKTLKPRVNELITSGFTRETLIQLTRYSSSALTRNNTVSRLQFWRNFIGSDEAFLKVIKRPMIINMDIVKKIIPRINLLKEHGLSDEEIVRLVMKETNILCQSPDTIKSNIEEIEKLGFPRESKMFLAALVVYSSMKKETLESRVAFFKTTYGWSQEDINLALKKYPNILIFSKENISSTMDFLIKKVGLDPMDIALRPTLLGFSLERRLIPRHYVLTVLKLKGLKLKCKFYTVAKLTEKQFVENFILAYKEELPDLEAAYAAACAGKMPLS